MCIGVYDQTGLTIEKPTQSVLDYMSNVISNNARVSTNTAVDESRRLLNKFDFPSSRWSQRLSMLSGGERRRLQLLTVLSKEPNFLILDEPSVDLDIATLQALESFLAEDYQGVLLVVSHDRFFADKVTDHLFLFEGDGAIKDFSGSLSEYASCLVELEDSRLVGPKQKSRTGSPVSYKEDKAQRNARLNKVRKAKKDMVSTEKEIESCKAKAITLEAKLAASSEEGWTVLAELTEELNLVNGNIDELETKWLELAEEVEREEAESTIG